RAACDASEVDVARGSCVRRRAGPAGARGGWSEEGGGGYGLDEANVVRLGGASVGDMEPEGEERTWTQGRSGVGLLEREGRGSGVDDGIGDGGASVSDAVVRAGGVGEGGNTGGDGRVELKENRQVCGRSRVESAEGQGAGGRGLIRGGASPAGGATRPGRGLGYGIGDDHTGGVLIASIGDREGVGDALAGGNCARGQGFRDREHRGGFGRDGDGVAGAACGLAGAPGAGLECSRGKSDAGGIGQGRDAGWEGIVDRDGEDTAGGTAGACKGGKGEGAGRSGRGR